MNDYLSTLLSIKETVGEIRTDLKLLQQDNLEFKQYLHDEVKPAIATYQRVIWLGHKFVWSMGFITLSGAVYAAIEKWK